MKIGQIDSSAAAAQVAADRKATAATKTGATAETDPSAKVELSATASLLAGGQSADFDAEKVQRVAQAIRDGKFQVNAEAIADKLIANAQDLLGRSPN
jgi:negative regulator of flagellin synthesis FlgM